MNSFQNNASTMNTPVCACKVTAEYAQKLELNAPCAPTWHHLKMNASTVELPLGALECPRFIINEEDGLRISEVSADHNPFAAAVSAAQARYQNALDAHVKDLAPRKPALDAPGTENLDVCSLSVYQKEQLECELSGSLEAGLEFLNQDDANKIFEHAKQYALEFPAGETHNLRMTIAGNPAEHAALWLDLVVHEQAHLNFTLELLNDAALAGLEGNTAQDKTERADTTEADVAEAKTANTPTGSLALYLRVFAEPQAHVEINSLQALPCTMLSIDKRLVFADESAVVENTHFELGGLENYSGLAADLRGKDARIDCTLSHLCTGTQSRDFDYLYQHHGQATQTNFGVNGVLAGESSKCLRATIDLIQGCKQAAGQEHENVLITDKRVANRTLPVILCSEDDVAGNHGATIGHINPEQLLYLGCRGIDPDQAEALFISAKLEDAFMRFDSQEARLRIRELAYELLPFVDEEVYSV